jgi:hypothetical protein
MPCSLAEFCQYFRYLDPDDGGSAFLKIVSEILSYNMSQKVVFLIVVAVRASN